MRGSQEQPRRPHFNKSSGQAASQTTGQSAGRVFNKTLAGEQPVPGMKASQSPTVEHTGTFRKDGSKYGSKASGQDHAFKGNKQHGFKGEHRFKGEHGKHHSNDDKYTLRTAIGSQSRAAAAKVLEAVAQGKSLGEAFPMFCHNLDDRDTAFVKEIVFGTLRQRRLLMNTMQPMLEHQLNEKQRIVHFLIISAMYQLVFLQSPPHAVVSATVSACGECGQKKFASLVNAILRRFLRENMQLKHSDDPAVEYSFPDWLYQSLHAAYGDKAVEIMQNSNTKPPLILRVEKSSLSPKQFMQSLKEREIGASLAAPELTDSAVILDEAMNVSEIPGFDQGKCSVQDLSAQLAAPLLELGDQPLKVLDCCCAPGGKTAHILDLNPHCLVSALDVDSARLHQTQMTLERLGRKAMLKVMDAQDLSSLPGVFDRILVDAPCSGTGVIRRHPDIKWLRRSKDIANLKTMQAKILDAAFAKLADNGVLLYTTCSILPEENQEQIEAFLQRHKDARLEPFTVGGIVHETWQRLPGEQNGDGFFYARIVKA